MHIAPRRRLRLAHFTTTPMIDLVFLLVFVFLAVGKFSEAWSLGRVGSLEDLSLPYARSAEPDQSPEEGLVIHVLEDGTLVVAGEPRSHAWLRDCLRIEARLSRAASGYSFRRIVIKADKRAPFRHIQKILNLCREPDIGIWRVAFGTVACGRSGEEEGWR